MTHGKKKDGSRPPQDWIETAAYFRWENRGRPHGDEWADWIEAEREVVEWMEASGILSSAAGPEPAPAPAKKPRARKAKGA
jgi:hypothetical protein